MIFNEASSNSSTKISNEYLKDTSKVVYDAIYPNIEKYFKSHSNAFQLDIRKYIDKNNETLFASGPTYRLYFTDDERDRIYSYIGMRKFQIEKIIKDDKRVEKSWYFFRPFYVVCTLLIKYYKDNKMQKQMENTILYMALSIYSGRHAISFKYPPNENIMNYTINNLSNKYKIKQYGNLIESIKDTALVNYNTYAEYVEVATDVLINTFIMALHTRIAGYLNKIAEEYYKNQQEGNYLNLEQDDYSDENFKIADNDSFVIDRVSTAVTSKILSKGIDYRIVKLSANMSQVSVNGLQKSLQDIVNTKNQDINKLITLILQIYLSEEGNTAKSIGSKKFIDHCLQIYVKSNTNDKLIIDMKDILDKWLTECSPMYVKTNRVATKNNLRKACFLYFVLSIEQEVIHMGI